MFGRKLFLAVCLLPLIAIPIVAQTSVNEAIPPCVGDDFTVIADVMSGFLDDYVVFSRGFIQMDISDIDAQINEADRLQTEWWAEIVPELPRCAFAIEIAQLWGRVMDETAIGVLLMDTQRLDMAYAHIETGMALQDQIIDLTDSLAQSIGD